MKQKKRPKAANDNRHNQLMWNFLHYWLDLWFENNQIPRIAFRYNRALHYLYELKNRPWIAEDDSTNDAMNWLRQQGLAWQDKITWPSPCSR